MLKIDGVIWEDGEKANKQIPNSEVNQHALKW